MQCSLRVGGTVLYVAARNNILHRSGCTFCTAIGLAPTCQLTVELLFWKELVALPMRMQGAISLNMNQLDLPARKHHNSKQLAEVPFLVTTPCTKNLALAVKGMPFMLNRACVSGACRQSSVVGPTASVVGPAMEWSRHSLATLPSLCFWAADGSAVE